ncbi:hypothetical protein [Vibrio phage RYC]|nr:hypothetical protein [Vibrio phage RYC]
MLNMRFQKVTNTQCLEGVYLEDIDDLVTNYPEVWLAQGFLWEYYSSEAALLEKYPEAEFNIIEN